MKSKENNKFSFGDRIKSFRYALNGLKVLLKEEHNSRIHVAIMVVVVAAGFLLHITKTEWLVICILFGLVLSLEIINSAIENLCDYVSPQKNEIIRKVKDLSASAVFIASFVSVICGAIIFVPRLCDLFL